MTRIFLSYDREDEAQARPVAALFERRGHSVWWDRQIKGGGEFAAEIEAALDAADKVVVLWSQRAVKSAWVRDEAAAGRDTGRLVPVTLDGTLPPLGFRQFQTIDFSKVKWRGNSPELEQLVEAVSTSGPGATSVRSAPAKKAWRVSRPLLISLLSVLLLTLVGVSAWLLRSSGTTDHPQIAITPADNTALATQAANDLTLALSDLPDGNASTYDLIDAGGAGPAPAELILAVGASGVGDHKRLGLSLRTSSGAILWSASIDRAGSAQLPLQAAVQAQRALSCAGEALAYRRETLDQNTLKLYVVGCATFDYATDTNVDLTQQVKLFEQVVAKAPHFEPAWAKMLAIETDELMAGSVDNLGLLAQKMSKQIKQAESLGLDFGELYAARAVTQWPLVFTDIFRIYDEGIKRHPDSDILYRLRSYRSTFVGRMSSAVYDADHAVQLNPLSPANRQALVSAYAYAGNTEAALGQLQKAEELWPTAPTIVAARGRFDLRFGDAKAALVRMQQQGNSSLHPELVAFLRARIDPTQANIERAIAESRKSFNADPAFIQQLVQTLGQFGRKEEVLDILLNYQGGTLGSLAAEVLFRPALSDVWRDPRSMEAAAHFGLLSYWRSSGFWPDFCFEPTLPYDCKKEAAKY